MPAPKANREKGRKGRRRLWLPAPFFFRPFSPRTGAGAMVLHMQLPWRWFAPGPAHKEEYFRSIDPEINNDDVEVLAHKEKG